MTDEKLIINFIENNYKFDGFNDTTVQFTVTDVNSTDTLTKVEFIDSVSQSFNGLKTNEISVYELSKWWFNMRVNEVLLEINDFLRRKIKVSLGQRSWHVTTYTGKEFDLKRLISMYEHKYSKVLITITYNEWYNQSIVEVSEKMVNCW
jgi:hypothetical protein